MAERDVRDFLNEKDFDHFHTLFRELWDRVVFICGDIHIYTSLLRRLYDQDPEIFIDGRVIVNLDAFSTLAEELISSARGFFFPRTCEDRYKDIVLSINRWHPYDEPAWDAMVTQMTVTLHPFIQSSWKHYEKISSFPCGKSPLAEQFQETLMIIDTRLDELSKMCTSSGIENYLFRIKQG